MSHIVWTGLDELKRMLRDLPADLTVEASVIVTDAAERAKQDIVTSYPDHLGNLRKGVSIGPGTNVGRFGASTVLKNNSPLAWIFENGSQARHYVTRNGVKHDTGRMPPAHVFIPIVIRQRRAMYVRLKEMLQNHGLTVTGDV